MKNIIFFDSNLGFELLENQEAQGNSIWFFFKTGQQANQTLHIAKGYYEYTFPLDSDTEQEFELESRFWASDGDTTAWLTYTGGASSTIYITFPENINTDAAVEQVDLTHFSVQGSRNEAQELRAQVIATTNTRDEIFGTGIRQKILELSWVTSRDATRGVFMATIAIQATDIGDGEDATITVYLRYNQEIDEMFQPEQTIRDGAHIITITYPVLEMETNYPNTMQVYLETTAGEITILQQRAKASIMASGLLDTNKFTGEIEVSDTITLIDIGGAGLQLVTIVDEFGGIEIEGQRLEARSDLVQIISLGAGLTLADIEDAFDQQIPATTLTWKKQAGAAQGTGADEYTWNAMKHSFIWGE